MSYPNKIVVSGYVPPPYSQISDINGIYTFSYLDTPAGTDESYPVYIKDTPINFPEGTSGPGLDYPAYNPPQIYVNVGGVERAWLINYAILAPWNPNLVLTSATRTSYRPPSLTWPGQWPGDPAADPAITWEGQPTMTVTAYNPVPPAPDPYAPWGGLSEYLRKRNILELF